MLSVYKKLIKYFFTIFSIYENGKYLKHKEKVRKEAHERYQNLSEEEKEIRQKRAQDIYQNLSEEEKEKKHQYILNVIRIFLKKKQKRKLSIWEIII